jgi:hypothetical protein
VTSESPATKVALTQAPESELEQKMLTYMATTDRIKALVDVAEMKPGSGSGETPGIINAALGHLREMMKESQGAPK